MISAEALKMTDREIRILKTKLALLICKIITKETQAKILWEKTIFEIINCSNEPSRPIVAFR